MPSVVKVLGIVTLVFLFIVVADTLDLLNYILSLNAPNIRNKIQEQYPDSDPDLEFVENCTICDDDGCRTYPGPCWKATFVIETEEGLQIVEALMDALGETVDKKVYPCIYWWCEANPCRYTYTEQVGNSNVEYINNDCFEPDIVCDSQFEKCRPCSANSECIATTITTEPGKTTYVYEVLGTGESATIDTVELVCRIRSRGSNLHHESSDVNGCRSLMTGNTMCIDGGCDFVPEFTLIPF
jgi:hypothetical protein